MTPTKRKPKSPSTSKTSNPTPSKFRIIKKGTTCKLSPTSRGEIQYHVAENSGDLFIRVAANSGGGFHSKQFLNIRDIEDVIGTQEGSFKATIFRPLYESSGANNHGFLAAALRAEGTL